MKKLLQILSILLFIYFTAYSQQEQINFSTDILNGKKKPNSIVLQGSNTENSINSILKKQDDNGFLLVEQNYVRWDKDESVWDLYYKYTYTYDVNNNNLIEELKEAYPYTNSYQNFSKTTYGYNANNNLVEMITYSWDTTYWRQVFKHVYYYDDNNILLEEERVSVWVNESEWRNYNKFLHIYDGDNNLQETTKQNWWNDISWENEQKNTYQYDENNNLIEDIRQDWNGSEWVNYWKLTYLYYENNPVEIWRKSWNGLEWEDLTKHLWTYDDNNNLILALTTRWNGSGWDDESKISYSYDGNNNLIKEIRQGWFEYEEEAYWLNSVKNTFYYVPVNSETVEYNRKDLDKSIEDFQTTEDDIIVEPVRDDLSLTGVEVMIDSVLHTSDSDLEFTIKHDGVEVTFINHAGGAGDNFIGTKVTDWGVDSISNGNAPFTGNYKPENPLYPLTGTNPEGTWTLSIYDGVEGNTGVLKRWGLVLIYSSSSGIGDKFEMEQFELFPNPASNTVNIHSSIFSHHAMTIEIIDLIGKKRLQKYIPAGSETIEIDVSHLKNGVYFCRLISENKSTSQKLIIQK